MDVGGVPNHVLTLTRGLALRHDVTVFCGAVDVSHAERLAAAGIRIRHIPFRRLPHPDDIRVLAALVAVLRRDRFDVVHTHTSKAALIGGIAARLARVPAIVNTAHNLGFLAFQQRSLRELFRLYDRTLFAVTAHRIVTVSERVRDGLLAGGIARPHKVVAIHNGIDVSGFEGDARAADAAALRAELGLTPAHCLIAVVARLVWFKGIDVLVAALPALLSASPHCRVAIAGAGPLRETLEAQARTLGVSAALIFLGERSDISAILAAADIFALPSVSEGLPISILEAMAAGKPVVASSVGGVPELVTDGETGCLVPPREPIALAKALMLLADDPALRQRMGAAGRACVAGTFTPARMVEKTEILYGDVLAGRATA